MPRTRGGARRAPPSQLLENFGLEKVPDLRRGKRYIPREGSIDPDLAMPGHGQSGPGCGDPFTAYCSIDSSHPKKCGRHQCATRNCPQCGRIRERTEPPIEAVVDAEERGPEFPQRGAWASKVVRNVCQRADFSYQSELHRSLPFGNGRLDTDGHRMDQRTPRIYHCVLSPRPRAWGYTRREESELRAQAVTIARERGLAGFELWMHAYRHDGGNATSASSYNRLGLHYHLIGVSRWAMMGPPLRAVRGRPPEAASEDHKLHAFDGKAWGPLRSRRVPLLDWVWKVVWFAQSTGHGMMVRNLERNQTSLKTGSAFANYLRRVVEYLFHHCTYYNAHRHPEDGPYGKPVFVRTPGRHATPASMAYGRFRERRPKDNHPDEQRLYDAVEAVWWPLRPRCGVCGSAMVEVYDDPDCPAARLLARIMTPQLRH